MGNIGVGRQKWFAPREICEISSHLVNIRSIAFKFDNDGGTLFLAKVIKQPSPRRADYCIPHGSPPPPL